MDDLKKPEVFAAYYEKVYRELYYFALHTLKNPQDAEDAVSETVTDAFAAVEKLRDNEKFRAWIFQILSNKCRRKLKEYTQKTVELPDDLPARKRACRCERHWIVWRKQNVRSSASML